MSQHSILYAIKREINDNLTLSAPLVASQLIYALSGFIGTALIAKLGEEALAASVLVSMIWLSLSVLFFGLLNSISVLVSHQYGAKNYTAISEILSQSFIVGILVMVSIILILLSMPFYLHYSHQPLPVIKLSIEYMHALLWMIPGLIILIICEQFLAGVNRTKLVLHISLLVVPIEIILIYALIFGKWVFPACGIAGIGYGFAITYSITAIYLMLYLLRANTFQKYMVKLPSKIQMKWLKELMRIGLPMGFMHVIEVSTFMFATFWIAQFGTTLLAAHQIVIQYLNLVTTLAFAMSQAVTIRVGHAVGQQNFMNIRISIFTGLLINIVIMIILSVSFNVFPAFFLSLDINVHDSSNALLVRESGLLLSISGILILFDSLRIIGFGALRGLKDTTFPMYAAFFTFGIIGLFSAYLLGFIFHYKAEGIWWGLTLGIACGAIIMYVRLKYLLKRVDLVQIMKV